MKKTLALLALAMPLALAAPPAFAADLPAELGEAHPYYRWQSDRSSFFFNTGDYNQTVFFDFFWPLDPPMKISTDDPLVKYDLDYPTYQQDGVLMASLTDICKLYGPWMDAAMKDDVLTVRHITYTADCISGHGGRNPVNDYEKTMWMLEVPMNGTQASVETTVYEKTRNNKEIDAMPVVSVEKNSCALDAAVTEKDGEIYLPVSSFLSALGKTAVQEGHWLTVRTYVPHIRSAAAAFTTTGADTANYGDDYLSSVYNPLLNEKLGDGLTWGDYMDGVLDGSIHDGYLWGAFWAGTEQLYTGELPENVEERGENDPSVEKEVNRIIAYCLYLPEGYDGTSSRVEVCLHGATGNESAAVDRLNSRGLYISEIADDYNAVVVFPLGPSWVKDVSRLAVLRSLEDCQEKFGVKVEDDKVFLWGNSAGGGGTLDLAIHYPKMWRAVSVQAPAAFNEKPYELMADVPMLAVLGTKDITIPYDTKHTVWADTIDDYVKNDSYMVIERGHHAYHYGYALRAMEDFFETVLHPEDYARTYQFETLTVTPGSKTVLMDGTAYEMAHEAKQLHGVTMLALSDLEEMYGKDFWTYNIDAYDTDPEKSVAVITIRYNGSCVNLRLSSTWVRLNAELYAEDLYTTDTAEVHETRVLSEKPTLMDGCIYVPAEDVLSLLGEKVVIAG